ncbi:MAG: threonine-phosphate decarboxylase [Bdellovibrionales bacterium]|nr:threonine-phosphate decarboxylase [Massilia sp.]
MLEHGGNLHDAARSFGRALETWVDLSTGLNPHGYPAPTLSPHAWHRLPQADPALLDAARHFYGMPSLLAVAGTQAAIQALPALRPPSRVVVAAPSYAEHAHHWSRHGHMMRQVAYADLQGALKECDVMVLCNPNNPTGATIPADQLLQWSRSLRARGGWLVVDEAFGDLAPELSVARWSGQPGLIVLRSVGKFFGLAGIRAGFVGAHEDLLAALAELLGPWPLTGPSQLIARAALEDLAWQTQARTSLAASGARMHGLLARHHMAVTGTPLFHWWPENQPEAFWRHMAERGILVRLFTQAARGIRVGLPATAEEWARFERALNDWNRKT